MPEMSDAKRWALSFIGENPGCTMSEIGAAMNTRPGLKRKGSGVLHKAQGMGRLGARMVSLLEHDGLVGTRYAHMSGPTYRIAHTTPAGRRALTQ